MGKVCGQEPDALGSTSSTCGPVGSSLGDAAGEEIFGSLGRSDILKEFFLILLSVKMSFGCGEMVVLRPARGNSSVSAICYQIFSVRKYNENMPVLGSGEYGRGPAPSPDCVAENETLHVKCSNKYTHKWQQ